MQRLILALSLFISSITTATVRADEVAADEQPRFAGALGRYAALNAGQRRAWLVDLVRLRLEPACRAAMVADSNAVQVVERDDLLNRIRTGPALTTDELLDVLAEIDRREGDALERLSDEYRRVTHDAVGTDLREYQRRMRLWDSIRAIAGHSGDVFDNQPKLIGWLQDAIAQQKISDRPPLPRTPDFDVAKDSKQSTAQVRTSLVIGERQLDAAELGPQIARYNADLADFVAQLYDPRILSVEELNRAVDRVASLALVRVGLALNVGALAEPDRQGLPEIELVDTAIALTQVKVSTARRQINPEAQRDLSEVEWNELAGLNEVARRLSMLANGPDR